MKTLVRLADRKGLLKGDINSIQETALLWLMSDEDEEDYLKWRFEMVAINPVLHKELFKSEETVADEWQTPGSAEEIEELIRQLEGPQTGYE